MVTLNSDGSIPMWMDDEGRPHPVQAALDDLKGAGPGSHTHDDYAASAHAHAGGGDHPDLATHTALGLSATHAHDFAASNHGHPHAHSYASNVHTHAQSDVTNLTSDLAGKAASGHNHDAAYATAAHVHATPTLVDGDIPASIARDTEVSAAITAHLSAATHGGEGGGFQFPVGALYLETTGVNPGTTFGYGTWSAFGVGRFLLGTDSQAEQTAGSSTHSHVLTNPTVANESAHTHTYTQTVNHVHPQMRLPTATGGVTGFTVDTSMSGTPAAANDTGNPTGGVAQGTTAAGSAHTHTLSGGAVADGATAPPSITVFMWKRTA